MAGYTGTLADVAHAQGTHRSTLTCTALRQSEDHKYTDSKAFGPFVTKTFSHHIPGYLGFQPREASNNKGESFRV
jgi:hypothetical protein